MGSLEAERTTTGRAGRDLSGILSPYTYTLRHKMIGEVVEVGSDVNTFRNCRPCNTDGQPTHGSFSGSMVVYQVTNEIAQEVSNKKPITKQDEYKGWFKVCFMLLLVCTTGPRGVKSEDIGNPLIPGSKAMDFLPANKNLRGLSVRRQMVGTEAAAMNDNFNYHNFPHGNSRPNSPASKQANPYKRPCSTGNYCRQGRKEKKSNERP